MPKPRMNREMLAALGKLGFNCVVVVPPTAWGAEKLVIAAFEDIEEALAYRDGRADAQAYDIERPWPSHDLYHGPLMHASKSAKEGENADERTPTADEAEGMKWYNSMTNEQRAGWLKRVGTGVPANAWMEFKRENGRLRS
ncbi:hypothetical protein IVB38_28315 [Bradyrhizobium sp. 38]|uniref:hypothetical protein n=1 Tax=unclassified Bradyrhizobium TaxID=2631580 RepID=UPI001FFB68AD|nr:MULTISPECIES: hypothetical protein [unclassified Bradyrhizobium]MCK1339801.1 hypothetical protein [Bradyrhizobium sp. 38]MCK1782732.1 hypothetical protein [Bradyrhizobium sp. 132]